jgi:hypothetical protein
VTGTACPVIPATDLGDAAEWWTDSATVRDETGRQEAVRARFGTSW